MKKRFGALVTILLAFALIFTACGKKTGTGENGNKNVEPGKLKGEISVQAEKEWKDYYEAAAKRITDKNPDVKINIIEVGAFDHLDKIDSTDASNKDVADVFAMPLDRLYSLSDKEVLAAIDAKKMSDEIGGWSDFDKGIGGNLKVGEDYLAFPFNIETLIDFVNTANAKANNVDISKPVDIAELKDAKTALIPLFDAWYGVAVTNAANIELLGKDKDGKLFSDLTLEWADLPKEKQAAIESIYKYWKLNFDEGTPLFDSEAGWGYIDNEFTTGNKGVVRLGGPWDTASISKQAGEGNLEILPIDQIMINGKPFAHWKGGWGLAINSRIESDADKMAVAEAMIKEIVNPEYAVDLFKATGKILENVKPEVYEKSELPDTDKKVISAVIKSYENAASRPLFREWKDVWDTWKNSILSWNSVKPASAEAAYKELKAAFDSMMTSIK